MRRSRFVAPVALLGIALLFGSSASRLNANQTTPQNKPDLGEQVRHALVMLPWYSVFDNLQYKVEGDVVTLSGQVSWPAVKVDAAAATKRIPGVSKVIDNIEVLPLSYSDNWIRWAAYRKLYNHNSPLWRYSLGAIPQIHILVKNGNITLTGVVAKESDKTTATLLVKSIPGVFSVTNSLQT